MLFLLADIIGRPVIAIPDGTPLGKVADPVFDAARGKVVAYRLGGRTRRLVSTVDVTTYLEDAVSVNGADAAQDAGDLPSIRPLLEEPVRLLGATVVTDAGRRLGRVKECTIETDGHFLTKLHVAPPIWRPAARELILPREAVIRFERKRVVVRYDEKVRPTELEPETAP
ncbi:MAG: PRC-barrel domain-containing protein [bacterium]|nr:PRC-barrel domain-containing protein [bacterium]